MATTHGAFSSATQYMTWRDAFNAIKNLLDPVAPVRPILRFKTSLPAVTLELGDYITASWTRGGRGTPYASARWRVESLSLQAENGIMEIEAVWCDDITAAASQPYLLDNEALLVRCTGSAGRTCTVTDASDSVTFSTGDLTADLVAVGDTLTILDATEAATAFLRNRVLLVSEVHPTSLKFSSAYSSTAFGAGGPFVLSTWTIARGQQTYHTAGSDPTNYPSGGSMYGKVANSLSAGHYSNGDPANLLLGG